MSDDETRPRPRARWSWLSFLAGFAGALVVLGGIWIGVTVKAANDAAAHEAYVACMARLGYYEDSPVTTDEELDLLIDAAVICHEHTDG